MNFISNELVTKIAHQKASMIDKHLAQFLIEQGFATDEWNVGAIKKELKDKGFEVFYELTNYSESEVHTFKLCKVFSMSSLVIPKPHI